MSWFQWSQTLFTESGRLFQQMLQEIDYAKIICLHFALLQVRLGGTSVRFNEHIEMHFVRYEDRTSEWMHRSAD